MSPEWRVVKLVAFTWAVAVCRRLGDGAGEGASAYLGGALVELLFLVGELDLQAEKDERSQPKIRTSKRSTHLLYARQQQRPLDYKRVLTKTCTCGFDSLRVQCRPQGTGRTSEPSSPFSLLYHTSLTWSFINFCPSSINSKKEHQFYFRCGQD